MFCVLGVRGRGVPCSRTPKAGASLSPSTGNQRRRRVFRRRRRDCADTIAFTSVCYEEEQLQTFLDPFMITENVGIDPGISPRTN
ncbi:uncharacterized protein IUM83_02049 [Phytophthora cinnamomi]|uniref:uncharacterized protein n=1 Tax=Phytophthora cinnamomi TaxID=4785 RepID=UPI00355AC75F|nr:hypothetical protein IUM83_02049 [Phytophthora cinnamomi]